MTRRCDCQIDTERPALRRACAHKVQTGGRQRACYLNLVTRCAVCEVVVHLVQRWWFSDDCAASREKQIVFNVLLDGGDGA